MKTYRLQNDTKWNYGFRWCISPYSFRGRMFQIFCFKQKEEQTDMGAMLSIDKGFMFTIEFELPRIQRGRFDTYLRTKNRYE